MPPETMFLGLGGRGGGVELLDPEFLGGRGGGVLPPEIMFLGGRGGGVGVELLDGGGVEGGVASDMSLGVVVDDAFFLFTSSTILMIPPIWNIMNELVW